MPFNIVLDEESLRSMDPHFREQLLRWYFDRPAAGGATVRRVTDDVSEPPRAIVAPVRDIADQVEQRERAGPVQVEDPVEEDSKRVSFPEFVRAGLIQPGDEILCKALKRHQRVGAQEFVAGAEVTADGSVEFQGRKYVKPSKLAVAMANSNKGAKPVEALNGYAYLFVRSGILRVSLEELRTVYANGLPDSTARTKAEKLAKSLSVTGKVRTAAHLLIAAQNLSKGLSIPDKPTSVEEALDLLQEQFDKGKIVI